MFKKRAPIDFMNRSGFAHSAAFLRVKKSLYDEARVFVYGENRFCFGYNFAKSGKYFGTYTLELILALQLRRRTCSGSERIDFPRPVFQLQLIPRVNGADSEFLIESEWKELGWTHVRRFLTDIGPVNTSLIKNLGILFLDSTQSSIPCTLLFR